MATLARALLVVLLLLVPFGALSAEATAPVVGKAAPEIAAKDIDGRAWSLSALKGRPVVLFFFCGCDACHRCAQEWSRIQASGALSAKPFSDPKTQPLAVVVLTEDPEGVRLFVRQTRLLPKQLALVPDPAEKATNAYAVDPCPRVFVLDSQGVIRYSNTSEDDAPQHQNEKLIADRVLAALRAAAASNLRSNR